MRGEGVSAMRGAGASATCSCEGVGGEGVSGEGGEGGVVRTECAKVLVFLKSIYQLFNC